MTMTKKTTTLVVRGPDGQSRSVTSERAARALAREWLGCRRVTETPETDGWAYWPVGAAEDTHRVVRVLVATEGHRVS